MKGYLGEVPVKTIEGPEAALVFISLYGQTDGAHHKQWVLDQVARILLGTKVWVTQARWENGLTELRYHMLEPSAAYLAWVETQRAGGYEYDEGIAP